MNRLFTSIVIGLVLLLTFTTANAAPLVSLSRTGSTSCLSTANANARVHLEWAVNMNDAPENAHRIAWNFFLKIGDGIIPTLPNEYESEYCLQAHADSCCNWCSGFGFTGNYRLINGEYLYQFGYAGTASTGNGACTGECGTNNCDGTTSGPFMETSLKLDLDYWSEMPLGTYYRDIYIFNTGNPGDENLWSCCGDQSGIECDGCENQCKRLGYTVVSDTISVCIIRVRDLPPPEERQPAGKLMPITTTTQIFENNVKDEINKAKKSCSWGKIKATY